VVSQRGAARASFADRALLGQHARRGRSTVYDWQTRASHRSVASMAVSGENLILYKCISKFILSLKTGPSVYHQYQYWYVA